MCCVSLAAVLSHFFLVIHQHYASHNSIRALGQINSFFFAMLNLAGFFAFVFIISFKDRPLNFLTLIYDNAETVEHGEL